MANNCEYEMRLVAKDKEVLKRVYDIMSYKDTEYYIYRVFTACVKTREVEVESAIEQRGEFYTLDVYGDVAWAISEWFATCERTEYKTDTGAHYITLDLLCKRLGFGVEVWANERGNGFQSYAKCEANGSIITETRDWVVNYLDENGEELDEAEESGGFEDYGEYSFASEIYGE